MTKKPLIAGDLFSGAGGLSLGFAQAGFRIVFGSDINPEYGRTYLENHAGAEFLPGSVENLSPENIFKKTGMKRGDLDVLLGGPPCQGFSINAPNRDSRDARNHLFREYGRLALDGLHPKVVVMENVPGMLSLEKGRFVKDVYKMFEEAGYRMQHMVLCAAHYGIPQERWRLFFIGTSLDASEITFPFPTHEAPVRANFTGGREVTWLKVLGNGGGNTDHKPFQLLPFTTVAEAISDLPPLSINEGGEVSEYLTPPESEYQKTMRDGGTNLFNHVSGHLAPQNLKRLKHIPAGGSWRDIPFELLPKGMKRARRSDHTRRYGRIDPSGLSGTVLTKCDPHWGSFFHYSQDRTLTVREAARIQSFPDSFRFFGSRVSQYVQVGNAVPPLLAKVIAEHIMETFF